MRPAIPILAATLALAAPAPADDPPPPADAKPSVVRVDDNTFRIGEVEFRKDSRSIRIPAEVNMTEGLLEFALVHSGGKVHEALLLTQANPTHVNLAFKLLRYQPSPELFYLPEEDGSQSNRLPDVDEATRAAARATVRVEWTAGGKKKSAPLHEWISHAITERAMPAAPWIYGGSYIHQGRFAAETTGDLIAIFTSQGALLNYAGNDKDNDEVWIPAHGRVPPEGTRVTVIISPAKPSPPTKP